MQKREKVYIFLHKSTDFWVRTKKIYQIYIFYDLFRYLKDIIRKCVRIFAV